MESNVEEDEVLSLEQLEAFNAEDSLRFAGLNDAVCTYPEGYIRQEIFACLTCSRKSGEAAGVCYACSLECHDGHDLLELYTKRLFACDCGNTRFSKTDTHRCKLQNEKEATTNRYNRYNDNFHNKWCTCKKPYPPEKGSVEYDSEMMQCVVCEDWFHMIHLGLDHDTTSLHDVEELICQGCVTKAPFLMAYKDGTNEPEPTDGTCLLATRTEAMATKPTTLMFAKSKEFRQSLCKCVECKRRYLQCEIEFLTDVNESLTKYHEDRATAAGEMNKTDAASEICKVVQSQLGADVAAVVSQKALRYIISELSVFKTVMCDEMKKLSDGVVTKDVAKRVFDRMHEIDAKRPRLDDDVSLDINAFDP